MSAADRLEDLNKEFDRLEAALARISHVHTSGRLGNDELEYSVEAFAIRAATVFEAFLRELFIDSVAGVSGLVHVKSYVSPRSADHAREIAYGGEQRLSWMPLGQTTERANRLLKYGQPFSRLELRQLDLVEKARVVRNRIAHDGEQALRAYEKAIVQGDQSFARPAVWLLFAREDDSSNLTKIVGRLRSTAQALASDKPDLDSLLGPAAPRPPDSWAPAGRYRCSSCRKTQILQTRGKLEGTGECEPCRWTLKLLYGL